MGGKHKQTQRTKQNTKPSSSGRTAEKLGESLLHFESFAGIKEVSFSLPAKDVENCMDADFQLIFKKMNKKDPTTKLKALQQFAELVSNSEPEAVKAVLAFWPRPYGLLASDAEHHVREAAHNAHHKIVLKVKRDLAPHLKQLIGPWFTSQYDNYAPAASAATRAFQDAFPQNKVQEVLLFCQEEVLSYILENLTMQPSQTGSSKTPLSEEDKARYERILVSNLKGYSVYLSTISEDNIKKAQEKNSAIISNNKFWKLAKHKMTTVRAAWFLVIATLCQKAPFLLETQKLHVCLTVLGKLDETEPIVLSHVWEAALIITTSVTEWSKFVDFEKVVLPKLWNVLKNGANGNASIVYPNLLPFISNLPETVNINTFYSSFFENFFIGLRHKNIMTGKSELNLAISSLIECIKFAFFKNHNDVSFCENIIKCHLMSLITWSLTEEQLNYKIIFTQLISLLEFWCRNVEIYQKYLNIFWDKITFLFYDTIHKSDDNTLKDISRRQIECLQYLGRKYKIRKQLRVQFQSSEEESSSEDLKPMHTKTDVCLYADNLNKCIFRICASHITLIDTKNNNDLLELLLLLLKDFDSKNLFESLVDSFKKPYELTNLLSLHEKILWKWLSRKNLKVQNVVQLSFYLLKYLNDQDKHKLLDSFDSELLNEECLDCCIHNAISAQYNSDPIVKKWLRQDQVKDFLLNILDNIISDSSFHERCDIIKQSFVQSKDGHLLLSAETVKIIIEKLKNPLSNPNVFGSTIDACANLASHIAKVIYTDEFVLIYGEDLLLNLFKLSCRDETSDQISRHTLDDVNTAWQSAVSILSKRISKQELVDKVVRKMGLMIEVEFLNSRSQMILKNLTDLIMLTHKAVPMYTNDLVYLLFNRKFVSEYINYITSICNTARYIKGEFCCPYEQLSFENDKNETDILNYFVWTDHKLDILLSNLENKLAEDVNEETEDDSDLIIDVVEPLDLLVSSLYDLALISTFCDSYKTTKYYSQLELCHTQIKRKVCVIFNRKSEYFNEVTEKLYENVEKHAWMWCSATFIFHKDLAKDNLSDVSKTRLCKLENRLAILHYIQTFGEFLRYDDLPTDLNIAETAVAIRGLIGTDGANKLVEEFLPKINYLRSKEDIFSCSDVDVRYKNTQEVIEVARLLSRFLDIHPECLEMNSWWDFCLISLALWSKSLLNVKSNYNKVEIQASITAIVDLYQRVESSIRLLKQKSPEHNFINEWEDLFKQGVHNDIFQLWLYLAKQFELNTCNFQYTQLLETFERVLSQCNHVFILKDVTGCFPNWSKLRKLCYNLLKNSNASLQLWGYKMLMSLVPGLIEIDVAAVEEQFSTENGLVFAQFEPLLTEINDIVSTMLSGFKTGEDTCQIEKFTDAFTYTFAYVLLWDVLLTLREKAPPDLSFQYADLLKESDMLKNMLNNLFRLMPAEIVHCNENIDSSQPTLFTAKPSLDINKPCTSETLEQMVCYMYYSLLKQLPALVRQWWSTAEVKVAQMVEKITSLHVSPSICAFELSAITSEENSYKNMTIKVMPSVREVLAVYTVDDCQMELVITLPANYPLGGPTVQCNRQIGGPSHKQWLMQLKKYLLHQNGHVCDALALWNKTLNRKFDGIEECYICFAVLHPSTYQLPKLSCQTCKKKFHSACLYRWFNTSNKSSCPICRNLF